MLSRIVNWILRSSTMVPVPRRSCTALAPATAPPATTKMHPCNTGSVKSKKSSFVYDFGIRGPSSVGFESAAHPVELRLLRRAAAAYDIQPARRITQGRTRLQEYRCGAQQLCPLARADRQDAIAMQPGPAIAHFDEHSAIAVAHDEIDLPIAAREVTRDQTQSRRQQMFFDDGFPNRSDVAHPCASWCRRTHLR